MKTTDEQIAKLPKWAQQRIEHLEMQVADRDRHIAEITLPPSEEPGAVSYGLHVPTTLEYRWHRIPSDETVNFHMPYHGEKDGGYVSIRWRDRTYAGKPKTHVLEIHAHDHLVVYPRASNVIWLAIRRPEGE